MRTGRIEPLDGLRGVAVLAVLAYHTANVPAAGRIGVDLFFVLSGYLITDIIARAYERAGSAFFGRFYLRRLIRLYPALILACALYGAICLGFPGLDADPVPSIAAALLMASNYTQAASFGFPAAMGHTWTLACEWQFYLVWPLVYVGVRRLGGGTRSLLAVLALAVVAVWLSRAASANTVWMWRSLDARADGLLYGCMLSLMLAARPAWRVPGIAALGAATGLAWIAVRPVPEVELYLSNALSAVLVLGILAGTVPALSHALSARWLTYTGRISYGLYLYHFPIAAAFYVAGYGSWWNLLLTSILSIPLAMASWRFVEEPLLRHRTRRPAATISA